MATARAAREAERQKDLEEARLRVQREEEFEAKRQARRLEEKHRAVSSPAPRLINGDAPSIPASPSVGSWRTKDPNLSSPSPMSSRSASGVYRPPGARPHTPSNGAAPPPRPETPSSGRPSIFGSRRSREESSAALSTARPSPFGNAQPVDRPPEKEKVVDSDGFQPAPTNAKWRPRIRGSGEAPPR